MSRSGGSNDDRKNPSPGRIRHDSSGRAIWEWAADTGKHALDSTSRLLKRLDASGLSLMPDQKGRKDETGKTDPPKDKPQSFNPYEGRSPTKVRQEAKTKRGWLDRFFGRRR